MRVRWDYVLMDCPEYGRHYAVGQAEQGFWALAWGPEPWRDRLPARSDPDAGEGFLVCRTLWRALSVLREMVEAVPGSRFSETVLEWQSDAGPDGQARLRPAALPRQ